MLAFGPVIGRLVTRIGPKPVLALGASVGIVGLLLFTFYRATTTELTIDAAVALIGVVAMIIPIVNMIPISVPKENTAVGLGMNTMLRNLGGAIGPVLATTILSTYYDTVKVPVPPYVYVFGNKTAFNTIFLVAAAVMIVVIALSLTVKNYTFAKNNTKNANAK
jgi:MFS family permease